MTGKALVIRGDALKLPLPDNSVDLIVSSPPYFALRSYRDGDEHYDGQLGSEPTPQAFLEALWAVMHECWRVLKPTGSCFINLGDKRCGYAGKNWGQGRDFTGEGRSDSTVPLTGPVSAPAVWGFRNKSKMLLPHRFAIGCEDGLADPEGKGWVMRSDIVWQKLNGLPESVTDRCRDSHEYLFHFTKEGRYFAAVDEVREPHSEHTLRYYGPGTVATQRPKQGPNNAQNGGHHLLTTVGNLGKLPGSVWPLASEPLIISDEVKAHYDLPDHFAAFPTELVRRVILGWSPSGVCVECGEGRRPVVHRPTTGHDNNGRAKEHGRETSGNAGMGGTAFRKMKEAGGGDRITGYACPCGLPSFCHTCQVNWNHDRNRTTVPGVARSASNDVRGVRNQLPSETVEGASVLLEEVFDSLDSEEPSGLQGWPDQDLSRVHPSPIAGAPSGVEGRVRDGAPAGDGEGAGSLFDDGRGRPPSERGEGRQSAGEPSGAPEASTRQPAEEPQASGVSRVRDRDPVPHPEVCPQCQQALGLPPTRSGVCLDIFGGTGTTAGVARALGRIGVSVDLSHDYSRLARWRIERSGHFAKVNQRTHRENQGSLL